MPPKLKKTFRPGEARTLNLRIKNRARERQPVHFTLKNVPEDWTVVLDKENLVLEGRSEGILKVSIQAPDPPADKEKVGMRLVSTPELEPDRESEIWILAKLRPDKDQTSQADQDDEVDDGGFLGRIRGGDEEDPGRTVIRPKAPEPETETVDEAPETDPAPPEPDEVVEYSFDRVDPPHGLFPSSSFYHVTHIPVGDGALLKFREQVQVVLRPSDDDEGEPFRQRMRNMDEVLAELLDSGYVAIDEPARPPVQ